MTKAIMPPRRSEQYSSKPPYGQLRNAYKQYDDHGEDDKGIVTAVDNKHSSVSNAPLWFDNNEIPNKKDDDDLFMKEMANRQLSLEEEKAKFMKQSTQEPKRKELGAKLNIDSIFESLESEGG